MAAPSCAPHVRRQRVLLRERRIELIALVWPLPSVSPHVCRRIPRMRERRETHLTFVRSLAGVHAHVYYHLVWVRVRCPTHVRLVRPLLEARRGDRAGAALSRHVAPFHVAVVVLTVVSEGGKGTAIHEGGLVRGEHKELCSLRRFCEQDTARARTRGTNTHTNTK